MQRRVKIGPLKIGVKKIYPELEDLEVTPTTEEQIFKSEKYGYNEVHINKVTSDIDKNIKPENIKEGTNILGVDGGYKGIDTSDATATGADILKDKTAYANGKQITGTIEEYDGSLSGNVEIGDEDLIPENIREGVEILGVVGTAKISNIKITDANYLFNNGARINHINEMLSLCEAVTDTNHMFNECYDLKDLTILSNLDMSNVKNSSYMFRKCISLTTIPSLDISNVKDGSYMFYDCPVLNVPYLDTSNITNMNGMFGFSTVYNSEMSVPLVDASKVEYINGVLAYRYTLTTLGGFKNLGKGYTWKRNNYTNYKLDLSYCENLTHESLMNVINNLYDLNLTYDVANGGTLYTQQLVLGNENLAKLTPEEIAIATSKGWTVS